MKLAALALLLLLSLGVCADTYTMKTTSGDSVRLMDEPCPVVTGWLTMKKAEMLYRGKFYAACWTFVNKHIIVFDEAGDISALPMIAFHKEEPI